jgi:hypothetical protein
MDSESKSESKPTRRAAITAASLLPPLIGLVCDFVPFGPFHSHASHILIGPSHSPRALCCAVLCCAVGLVLEYRQLCTERKMLCPRARSTPIAISLSGMQNRIRFWSIHSNAIGHSSERSAPKAKAPVNSSIRVECAFIATD